MQVGSGYRPVQPDNEATPKALELILSHINTGVASNDRDKVLKAIRAAILAQPPLLDKTLAKLGISIKGLKVDVTNPEAVTDVVIKLHKENIKTQNIKIQPDKPIAPTPDIAPASFKIGIKRVMPAKSDEKVTEVAKAATVQPKEMPAWKKEANKLFNKELWTQLATQPPIEGKEEIIVTGYVLGGKGDWIAMCATCKALATEFPGRPIRLIAAALESHKGTLELPKGVTVNLAYFGDNFMRPPQIPAEIFEPTDILEKVRNAGAIFYGPIDMPGLYKPVGDVMRKVGVALHEYDGTTNMDTLCTNHAHLGLAPDNLGIFTQSAKREYSFADLENSRLKSLLFQDDDVPSYQAKKDLYFSYTKEATAINFMINAASYSQGRNKDIDICMPTKANLQLLESEIAEARLQELGVGKVVIIRYDEKGQKVEKEIVLSESGRVMRLLDVGLLTRKDFKVLTQISSPIVGCTGDSSLAQALSYGKIPFYEVLGHKKHLADNILKMTEQLFGKDAALYEYLKQAFKENREFVHPKIPLTDEIIAQAKKLGEHIQSSPQARFYLKGIANDRLLHTTNPQLAEEIEKIREKFFADTKKVLYSERAKAKLLQEAKMRLAQAISANKT